MENSEHVSTPPICQVQGSGQRPVADMLPFSGLGFDLGSVPAGRIRAATAKDADAPVAAFPLSDTPFPSGKRLQLRLGREIRGR